MSTYQATIRENLGTGSTRALRREGKLPAVIYGGGAAPQHIALDPRDLVKGVNTRGFFAQTLHIEVSGKKIQVLPKEVQFHPVNDSPLHADFIAVDDKTVVTVEVPIRLLNRDKCRGLKMGGNLNVIRTNVSVICPAARIPEGFDIDLANVKIGESIKSSRITLPEGVKFAIDRDFTIANVAAPRGMTAEEQRAAEGGE